jgi:SWI/SNF-related matrix-associated actin-dependent regulator of chromatin subfamily A3
MVATLTMHEEIVLRREPTNPYDRNAIRVERLNREQIGYINRHLAAELADHVDVEGGSANGQVAALTGGGYDGYSLGVNIEFLVSNAWGSGKKI